MDKSAKTILILAGVGALGYIAFRAYKNSQKVTEAAPQTVQVGVAANGPASETAQIIGAANNTLNTLAAIISKNHGSN